MISLREQLALYLTESLPSERVLPPSTQQQNALQATDHPFHDWYRFVLAYPPHLVRHYLQDFGLTAAQTILDPFCGTGTTVVEAKRNHIQGVGIEANPFPQFAASMKVDWSIDPDRLCNAALEIAENTLDRLQQEGIDDNNTFAKHTNDDHTLRTLKPEQADLLIANSISPLPLHKTLVLLDFLKLHKQETYYPHARLALGNALVTTIGNLRFGPEVGIGKIKQDVPVVKAWLAEIGKMRRDLQSVRGQVYPTCRVHHGDARNAAQILAPCSIDAVITSPPYPNEKDYTRTTRLESVLLGFVENMAQLRGFKKTLVRSNTRSVYVADQDDRWVADHSEIQRIAAEIEQRRIDMHKTSGFEKLYGRVTKLYFGGMARHLAELQPVLRPGARLAYVVGDQASYLQVMIRTGQLLADIADRLGYQVDRIDLFRTRFATATQADLREEAVVLTWPCKKSRCKRVTI